MNIQHETESVRQALHQGRLTVPDESGYYRSMHANCPKDGTRASAYMTEKHGEAITSVTFRCPTCGTHFEAGPETIYLA